MQTPALALKLKNFRRRFGIAAPRVSVRSHIGWHWHAATLALVIMLTGGIVWFMARQGDASQTAEEIRVLSQKLAERDDELLRLRASAGTEQNVVRMERSTRQQLLARIRALEVENAALKEDIALFDRLVPADRSESSIRIERLQVMPEAEAGRYRYRILLGFQPGKAEKEFRGRLQLHAVIVRGGQERTMILADAREQGGEELGLVVKNFLRKEGGFAIPLGDKLKSIEARLLQGDAIKAKLLVQL